MNHKERRDSEKPWLPRSSYKLQNFQRVNFLFLTFVELDSLTNHSK